MFAGPPFGCRCGAWTRGRRFGAFFSGLVLAGVVRRGCGLMVGVLFLATQRGLPGHRTLGFGEIIRVIFQKHPGRRGPRPEGDSTLHQFFLDLRLGMIAIYTVLAIGALLLTAGLPCGCTTMKVAASAIGINNHLV